MSRNVALGQYYPANSFIHSLDPRVKIIISLTVLVVIFIINTFWGFLGIGIFFGIQIALSKVKLSCIFRTIKPLLLIIVIAFVLNMFFYDGETVWFESGIIRITEEGFVRAVFMAVRLALLIMSTSLLTLTTSPVQLTDGLESLAAPLKKIKVPVHEMAMMMSIALRFIPTLTDETDRLKKAQAARGADFNSGNIFVRARNMIPILVPLFISAFKRADDLALAMEARCYHGGEGRTKMRVLIFTKKDAMALVISEVICILLAVFL